MDQRSPPELDDGRVQGQPTRQRDQETLHSDLSHDAVTVVASALMQVKQAS